jgi:hypothetical protein
LAQYLDTVRHFFKGIDSLVEAINAKKTIKQIRRGLSIYRTCRSSFWHARNYDPVNKVKVRIKANISPGITAMDFGRNDRLVLSLE